MTKALLAECMHAWKVLGLAVLLEANGAVQLLLHYFKNITHSGDLLSHDRPELMEINKTQSNYKRGRNQKVAKASKGKDQRKEPLF